jgi:hypothetical protein
MSVTPINKKKSSHATQSFTQLTADVSTAKLKPYIDEQINRIGTEIINQIYIAMANDRAMIQTRQLAFERLLKQHLPGFSEEVMAIAVAEVEDEAAGMEAVNTPVEAGDKVRLALTTPQETVKVLVHSVLTKGPGGQLQTIKELEEGLIGCKAGETKSFDLPNLMEHEKSTPVTISIIRVSRKREGASK